MVSIRQCICAEQLENALAQTDLTEEPGHCIALLMNEILCGLEILGWPKAQVIRGSRVVTAEEHYGLLGYAPGEITLGCEHTRWISDHLLLRTQTTSLIPAALQSIAETRQRGEVRLLAAPGITFRRDTRDCWHCAEPHQMDIWVIGDPDLSTREHLLKLVQGILSVALDNRSWAFRENPHHYTDGGLEVNVHDAGKMIEVLECGRIGRSLLERLGIDHTRHGGLALGMGLDRLTMLRKGIADIRLLRDDHERVAAQMHDLAPWKAVSRLPCISRDISLAVTPGQSEAALTEHLLAVAGDQAPWIEEMQVKGRWAMHELTEQAIERLGLLPGQENVLLGIVLRDAVRSITAEEANALYQRIQAGLHEGKSGGDYRLE